MRTRMTILMLALLLLVVAVTPVLASDTHTPPATTCPSGFDELHHVHADGSHHAPDHEGPDHEHMDHKHAGSAEADKNGDNWICVKKAGKDGKVHVHVHVDNNYPRGS